LGVSFKTKHTIHFPLRENINLTFPLEPFIPIILLPVAGYIITWINEKAGTAIMIIGGVILFGYFINLQDIKMAFLFGVPFIVAASLFILHIGKRTALQHKKP